MTPQFLINLLLENEFSYITGVPDSIFKHLIIAVNNDQRFQHVISNNEGESCALAAGYHIATGKVPIVYLQNSGFGNCINPLTSLLDSYIYSIPALILMGWRGVPGEKDEPQHKRMGEITAGLLALLNIPYAITDSSEEKITTCLKLAKQNFQQHSKPYAILFPNNIITVEESKNKKIIPQGALLREDLLEHIVKNLNQEAILVTTTGKTSRELYEIRQRLGHDHSHDFLTVGSMGCASSIALGIATQRQDKKVVLIDGDGACLMRLEALSTIGYLQPKNLLHIVVDNNAYESTGSQKTQSSNVDFSAIAKACKYRAAVTVESLPDFMHHFLQFDQGPSMIVVKSFPYSRPELGRPKSTPIENKQALMQTLGVR